MKRDLTVNYYDTRYNRWVNINGLDIEVNNNLLYRILDEHQPLNMDIYRNKFNFSIYKPLQKMSLVDFSPGKIVLNIDTNLDLFWDDQIFNRIRKYILGKRLYSFNPSFFMFDTEIDSWTTNDKRIVFSVDRATIQEDVVRHIMSAAWLLLVGLISPAEMKEFLDKLRPSFIFAVGYSQDSYVYVKAVPVLNSGTS